MTTWMVGTGRDPLGRFPEDEIFRVADPEEDDKIATYKIGSGLAADLLVKGYVRELSIDEITERLRANEASEKLRRAQTTVASFEDVEVDSPGGWLEIEEALGDMDFEAATATAHAYATIWRATADDPGFQQPAGDLVRYVEEITGERVWS